jgi:hypothetical protein
MKGNMFRIYTNIQKINLKVFRVAGSTCCRTVIWLSISAEIISGSDTYGVLMAILKGTLSGADHQLVTG